VIILASGETLGGRLRRRRQARGWSQLALASHAGLDQSDVSKWERNVHHPRPVSLVRLATALGCDLADLLR
jgi:transcriptional regulator with XRE-family HTH domain